MVTFAKPHSPLQSVGESQLEPTAQIITQLKEWRNELTFWETETSYYLHLIALKHGTATPGSVLVSKHIEHFIQNEIFVFLKEMDGFESNWNAPKEQAGSLSETTWNKYRLFRKRFREMKLKFRSIKVKALKELVLSYPVQFF